MGLPRRPGREAPPTGEKTAERILKGIADHRLRVGRLPYVRSRRMGECLVAMLTDHPAVQRCQLTGSVRRGRATIGDLDIPVASDDGLAVASRFVTLSEVEQILLQGQGRASVRLSNIQQWDVRVVMEATWGAGCATSPGAGFTTSPRGLGRSSSGA